MCDVWDGSPGMQTEPFFSSDTPQAVASHQHQDSQTDIGPLPSQGGAAVQTPVTASHQNGKRKREESDIASAMRTVGAGLSDMALAIRDSKSHPAPPLSESSTTTPQLQEVMNTLRSLTQSFNAQTEALTNLVKHLSQRDQSSQ